MTPDSLIDCGQRLGKLSLKQFSEATQKYGLGRCISAAPLPGDIFRQNVSLTTEKGEWIFRGCSHYSWQFPKERFFATLLGRETVAPVPLPYFVDKSLETFKYDYVLMPKMPGLQLSDQAYFKTLATSDQQKIASQLGRFLRDLQAYQAPFFGDYDEVTDDMTSYSGLYSDEVRSRAARLIREANSVTVSVSDEEVEALSSMFQEYLPRMDDSRPVVVMQDYKDGNLCVTETEGGWKITGLFDLMEARFGHAFEDLPRQYAAYLEAQRPDLANSFLAGYGLKDEDLVFFDCFMVVDRLIVWEYGVRMGKWWSADETFSDWIQKYRLS